MVSTVRLTIRTCTPAGPHYLPQGTFHLSRPFGHHGPTHLYCFPGSPDSTKNKTTPTEAGIDTSGPSTKKTI
eukprot:gene3911-4284_t